VPDALHHVLPDTERDQGVITGEEIVVPHGRGLYGIHALLQPARPEGECLMPREGRVGWQQLWVITVIVGVLPQTDIASCRPG